MLPIYYEDEMVSGFDVLPAKVLWTNSKGSFLEAALDDNEHFVYGFCSCRLNPDAKVLVSIIRAFNKDQTKANNDFLKDRYQYLFRAESITFPH